MNIELRKKLSEVIEQAVELAGKRGDLSPQVVSRDTKSVSQGTKNVPAGTARGTSRYRNPYRRVRFWRYIHRRLREQAAWKAIQAELAADAMAEMVNRTVGVALRRASTLDQFTLPGFDHLPKTIAIGKRPASLGQVKVSEFLAYEAKYQTRSQRNQDRADEFHRLAEKLKPLAGSDLTVSEACFPPADVVIMARKNG